MADTPIVYHLDSLYRQAFPDVASKVLTKLDGVRDLGMSKLDQALGDGFQLGGDTGRPAPQLDFKGIDTTIIVQGDEMSYLGTPIFQPVTFMGGMYQQFGTGRQQGEVVDAAYAGWMLPATTTVEFKRSKEITKSHPSTGIGTTKELWQIEDWEITIRGLILDGQPNYFPEGQLRQLLSYEKIVDAIDVQGAMFNYLGIRRLVIESLSIGQVAGKPNVIPFQMQCVSDEPLELFILSNSIK